jgi:hypothetical protein
MNRAEHSIFSYMAKHPDLEPTAALVMIWARELYLSGSPARFYSCLDLTVGDGMMRACEAVCPWYGQVILNRKWFIRQCVSEYIAGVGAPAQIIIPAAGKSPLALELLDAFSDRIASVVEIDVMGMEEKHKLYERVAPDHAEKIRCIHADLHELEGTSAAVLKTGRYNPGLPTCVITEGISYYIPPDVLSGTISLFASEGCRNRVILEYLLPCRLISEERRGFPRGVWRIINRDCNPGGTTTYSPDEMERTLANAGCTRVMQHHMHDIERQRTGANRYFPAISDGWIQIATARL